MPIATGNNVNYGPPLVTMKYSPLFNIQYAQPDTVVYSALLTNRRALLQSLNLLGLAVPNTGPPQTGPGPTSLRPKLATSRPWSWYRALGRAGSLEGMLQRSFNWVPWACNRSRMPAISQPSLPAPARRRRPQ